MFLFAGSFSLPPRVPEYNYVGSVLHERIPVVAGRLTGLPLPVFSEIVLEGFLYPDELKSEGKFGEWPGYYVSDARPEPVLQVKVVYYRNDPIILGAWPGRPPHDSTYRHSIIKSANLWELLERARIGGITGVYRPEAGAGNLLTLVSLKQAYDGHARQVAVVASQLLQPSHPTRYVIVVDDDIDVTNTNDVLWALTTRSNPEIDIEIIRRSWSGPLDPIIPKGQKGHSSRGIIDACRPYEWISDFPPVAESSPEVRRAAEEKWGKILDE